MSQSERSTVVLLVVAVAATAVGAVPATAPETDSDEEVAGLVLHLVLPEQFKSQSSRIVPLDAPGEVLTEFAVDENNCKVWVYLDLASQFGDAEFAELSDTLVDSLRMQGGTVDDKWVVERNEARVLAATVISEHFFQAFIFRSYQGHRIRVDFSCPTLVGLSATRTLVDEIVDGVSRATTPEFRIEADGETATVLIP